MDANQSSISNKRRIGGNILIFIGGLLLIGSAAAKFAHVPKVITQLAALGFDGNRLMAIGILELVSALLFLVPLTRSAGLLLVSAYMGGAVATHVGHGSSPWIQPALVLCLLWLGAYLRHPVILWGFVSDTQDSLQLMTRNAELNG
jgi:hypothetical protein